MAILILGTPGLAAPQNCSTDFNSAGAKRSRETQIYICQIDGEEQFCSRSTGDKCRAVSLSTGFERLNDKRLASDPTETRLFKQVQASSQEGKSVLAAFLALTNWQENILYRPRFTVQTGPYRQLTISPQALSSRCLATLLHVAYKIEQAFQDYSFVVDSQIHNCQNLREGLRRIIANTGRIKKNLDTFKSPLHSVFLTTETKFNHYVLGQMGLHINVDSPDEIQLRLIDFKIGTNEIHHENPPARLNAQSL